MERNPKLQNAWDPLPNRDLAAEVLGAWRDAAALAGLSGKRKVDARRTILGMAAMSGSGFAYPGLVSRVIPGREDGQDDQEDR
jgi:hypothetical protein